MSKFHPHTLHWFIAQMRATKETPAIGDVVYQPTHQLREVVEVVTPEIPGKPVEPYVGLSWVYFTSPRVVVEVTDNLYTVAHKDPCDDGWGTSKSAIGGYVWENYPRTDPTPAVTRTVRKWVRLAASEVAAPDLDPPEEEPYTGPCADDLVVNGWIPWNGGDCPVKRGATVSIKDRCGDVKNGLGTAFDWIHRAHDSNTDIIAYKVVG